MYAYKIHTVFDKRCIKVELTTCTTGSTIKREGQLSDGVQWATFDFVYLEKFC